MDRLNILKKYALETPNDPFNYYAMALEYLKTDPSEAVLLFESLVSRHPEYLPTYYPYAQILAERKESKKAEAIYNKGIEAARSAGDDKTLREIQAAFNDWKLESGGW